MCLSVCYVFNQFNFSEQRHIIVLSTNWKTIVTVLTFVRACGHWTLSTTYFARRNRFISLCHFLIWAHSYPPLHNERLYVKRAFFCIPHPKKWVQLQLVHLKLFWWFTNTTRNNVRKTDDQTLFIQIRLVRTGYRIMYFNQLSEKWSL